MGIASLRDERGTVLVEALTAAVVLTLGAGTAMALITTANRTGHRAKQSQALAGRVQAELEAIRRRPFTEIALTQAPAASADSEDPRSRVSGSRFATDPDAPATTDPLVVSATDGAIAPGPTAFSEGGVSGRIFRFIVSRPSAGCPACPAVRRIVVVADVDGAERPYQEAHTDVVDPETFPQSNPVAPAGPKGPPA
jgi:hypothetical protein